MIHKMTPFCERGDITLGWEDKDRATVLPMIEKKMQEGCVFFIIGHQNEQVRLQRIDQLKKINKVVISDRDIKSLLENGDMGLVPDADSHGDVECLSVAKTAEEVFENDTVMHRGPVGG